MALGLGGALAIGGGLLGGLRGGQTRSSPYSPYIREALGSAQSLFRDVDPQYSNLYAGQSPTTQAAIQGLGSFAPETSQAASGLLGRTLGGEFLDPATNPYLRQTFERGADVLQGRLGSQFAGAGRTQSGAYAGATGQALSDLAGNIYGSAYDAERQRQMQAAGLAPGIDQSLIGGLQQNLLAGQLTDVDRSALLAEQNRQANFPYESGWDELSRYLGVIGGAAQAQPQQDLYRNRGAGILGGALGGAQLGQIIPGVGPLAGAIGGGLLGGF